MWEKWPHHVQRINPRLRSTKIIFTSVFIFQLLCIMGGSYASNWLVEAATATARTDTLAIITLEREQSILDNFKENGFNDDKSINDGLGGLWINWKYSTSPLETNFNNTGKTDKNIGVSLRHDPLTDIRYLHTLWLYTAQNPGDHRYQSQIAKYTPIVKEEYANTHDGRGWLYDEELIDLYRLSRDGDYKQYALSLAQSYSQAFDSKVGSIYHITSSHPYGYYRVDSALEAGCALIQAGTQFNNPLWVKQGRSIFTFVYQHAYVQQYHIFPSQVDNVLLHDGSVNPHETFFSDQDEYDNTIRGYQFRLGEVGQIVLSLLHTTQVTHQPFYQDLAAQILNGLTDTQNKLGLWDTEYEGYFFGAQFTGTGPHDPGQLIIMSHKKEAGRQMAMLQAFHLADKMMGHKYQETEQLLIDVADNKAYYAPGHGVLYKVNSNWSPYITHNIVCDWVTTEAMGMELEALLAVSG